MGCSDEDAAGTVTEESAVRCAPGGDPDSDAPPADGRPISFAAEVLPVFVASCAFATCHGAPSGANNGVALGGRGAANDASAIRAALVGRPSGQSPSTPFVTPGAPSRSYLYRKLTGDTCGLPECSGEGCGRRMPRGGYPLEPAALEAVRAWIVQGAPDS